MSKFYINKMFIYILLFINLFSFSLSIDLIKNLTYNIEYTENLDDYKNGFLPSGTNYYIRFPSIFKNELIFYISIPKNIELFEVHLLKYSDYPDNNTIVNIAPVLDETLEFKNIGNFDFYKRYSTNINSNDYYIILYFQINAPINILSYYANLISVTNIPCNEKKNFKNIYKNNRLYIRLDYQKYSGENFEIKINYETKYEDSYIELDMKKFKDNPQDDEVYTINDNWDKNLRGKKTPNEDNFFSSSKVKKYDIIYEVNTNKDDKYIAFQIESGSDLENLDFILSASKSFPSWAIVLIVIAIVILFVVLAIIFNKRLRDCRVCFECFCCCCYIISAFVKR